MRASEISGPVTIAELMERGYERDNDANCHACGAAIEWWIDSHGRELPMERKAGMRAPHAASCFTKLKRIGIALAQMLVLR